MRYKGEIIRICSQMNLTPVTAENRSVIAENIQRILATEDKEITIEEVLEVMELYFKEYYFDKPEIIEHSVFGHEWDNHLNFAKKEIEENKILEDYKKKNTKKKK